MVRGIIIACPKKYENICLNNICLLRDNLNCQLEIEIWEIGNEVSDNIKNEMISKNCKFKNVADYCSTPNEWKGFQIKAFALYYTDFDEVILCDADITFYKNPEIIYNDDNYIRTGSYFFKDLERWKFENLSDKGNNKFNSIASYNQRKSFIKGLIPENTNLFPKEWEYLYEDNLPKEPVKEALQESGVVYMNKSKHKNSIENIFKLNENYRVTYKYIWGDKETFWIGCVMSNTTFHFNSESGIMYNNCLTHFYKNEIFWKQK